MSWMAIEDIGDLLTDPPEGEQQVRGHDKAYGEIRDGFDTVRDACNKGIDKVNGWLAQAGRSERLPRLTEQSLDHYVVFPLSGNYYRIQQNASACGILQTGMNQWAANFSTLSRNSVLAFEGRAQLSFVAQTSVYNLVMRGVGGVVKAGSVVFDSIATFSEKIAINVEKALIEMGKRLLRLAKVVGKRFLGGWASLAVLIKDLAEKGLDVIYDVVEDVQWCINAIDKCFELKDEIEAWAQTQADRLAAFKEIADMVTELPKVDLGTALSGVEPIDASAIEGRLGDVAPDFSQTEDGEAAEEAVEEAGDQIVADSGYVNSSWEEACATPPIGFEDAPYDPALVGWTSSDDPLSLQPDKPLPPPIPGRSSQEYYDYYEEWRKSLPPPSGVLADPPPAPPPARGKPRDA